MKFYIKHFNQLSKSDTAIAGGKGASLGEMTQAGIIVPPGFVVLSAGFEKFLEETDLNVEIDTILHSVNIKEMHTIENASEKIKDLILKAKMPKDISEEIKKEFRNLNAKFVAVRSSATAEDSSSAAWAGQLDSFLNTTEETLLANVQKCWASLFTPRAIFYRFEKGLHNSKISVAVVVQKMVESEVSGIAFSVHPVTQDHNQMIIEAGYGLGEAIVSGQITPDSYVAEKSPRRIIDKNISVQERGIYRKNKGGGSEWQSIPPEKGQQQKLADEQILELSELIIKIEKHYGAPQDIEWAMENSQFYITQSRPITTLSLTNKITIAEKCINALGGQELFPPLHNCSLFINGSKWNIKKYYDKHYSDRTPFPLMVIAKENEGIMFMQLTKMKRLAEEVFKLFWRSDLTLEERVNKYKKQTQVVDNIYNKIIVKNELERESLPNLIRQAKQMRDAAYETNSIPYFSIYFDKEMCSHLLNEVGSKINMQKLNVIWEKGTTPAFESFEKRREGYILELLERGETWKEISIKCQYFMANYNKISSLEETEEKLKKKYSGLEKTEKIKKIIAEEEAKKEKIISEHIEWLSTLSSEKKKLVKFLQIIMELRDARKDPLSKFFIVAFRISQKLFKEINLDEKLIYFCTFDEIIKGNNYLLKNKEFLEKRPKGCSILIYYDGSEEIEYGTFEETKNKLEFFLSQQAKDKDSKIIKGQAGSFGKIKGMVRIIMNTAKESDNFNEGDVLVTGMTRPEFIDLIKKASAIITDEGGITCHAAIVSRELGIPCVIGTKFATQVLHDGDLVEVDADKGVVRILGDSEVSSKSEKEELLILRDRPRALAPVYWNAVLQTSQAIKENYGKSLNVLYNRFVNGRMNGIVSKLEWSQLGEYIAEKLINEKGYFENIEKKTEKAKQEINLFLIELKETNLTKLSFQNLINLAEKIRALLMEYYASSLFAWYVAGDAVKQKISARLKLYGEDIDIIALPEEKTLVNQMEEDVVKAALKNKPIEKAAKLLAEKYYWIPFGYDGPDIWDDKHFVNRIKEYRGDINEAEIKFDKIMKQSMELKQKLKKIIKIKKLDKEEKKLVRILRSTATWTDERKMLEFQLFFYYRQILSELEKRYKISVIHLKHLFMHELKNIDKESQALKKIAEQRMEHEFMTISENGNIRIATESELRKIKMIIERQEQQLRKDDIQGNVACRGREAKYVAHVKVLHSPKECSKIENGEILVATMTTPEYVPAMVRALGFITDEGGVTCHAAISAREMNKFCIIGTKIATKVLHDGDLVEVDADKGVVRVLEKAK